MTQAEIDRAVSRATGESLATIRSLGFSALDSIDEGPHILDWDEMDQERLRLLPIRSANRRRAA